MEQVAGQGHWHAKLELGFTEAAGKTVVSHTRHIGPLVIQKPFYPEGGVCHAYILHPPGGVVGGDHLTIEANVGGAGHALLTTPAAGKFYRSDGATACLQNDLTVAGDSCLEWLPQETIMFAGSRADMRTIVRLEQGASFIGWELVCLGRPASGESYDRGSLSQNFEVWRDSAPLVIDRARLSGQDRMLSTSWGLQGHTVYGTMLAVNVSDDMLSQIREHMSAAGRGTLDGVISLTLIRDVLVCRAIGYNAEHVRRSFVELWSVLRRLLLNRAACEPRIWAT